MTFDSALSGFDWVVFDVTGTLLRPEPSPTEVYRSIAASFGHSIDPTMLQRRFRDAFLRHFGGSPRATSTDALTRPPTDEAFERDRWRRVVLDSLAELSKSHHDAAFHALWEHFRLAAHWNWIEGARELVTRLQGEGVRLAIATNFDSRVLEILDGHPPLDRIADRFLSSEIGFSKPDPRFFEAVAERLGAPPARILMIGDDPINDLAGSRAAGWQAIAIDDALPVEARPASKKGANQLLNPGVGTS